VSKSSGVILALALGIHAFFEGIAFGLQGQVENAAQLAAGILIHKGAAVISLGGAFSRTGYSQKAICLFLSVFSLTAPLGIVIGMLISGSNKLVDVVFLSISAGTFIYVACSEIIVNEFARGHYKALKILFVILGVVVITMLWFLEGEHNHSSCKIPATANATAPANDDP
jgi:zinc transporter 1/2/3